MSCNKCREKKNQTPRKIQANKNVLDEHRKTRLMRRLGNAARGSMGMLKYVTGLGSVADELVAARGKVCESCPEGIYDLGVCREDRGGCGCVLFYKVRIDGERCPHGHWDDLTGGGNG